jgi:hypothetical protein
MIPSSTHPSLAEDGLSVTGVTILAAAVGALVGAIGKSNIKAAMTIFAAYGLVNMIAVTLANRFTSEDIYPVVMLIANAACTTMAIFALRRFGIIGAVGTAILGAGASMALASGIFAGVTALR